MASGTKTTIEQAEQIITYRKRYSSLSNEEIARLVGVGEDTVRAALEGSLPCQKGQKKEQSDIDKLLVSMKTLELAIIQVGVLVAAGTGQKKEAELLEGVLQRQGKRSIREVAGNRKD